MKRVYLRALEPEDALITYAWRQNHDIVDMLGGNLRFISKERESQWTQNKSIDDTHGVYVAICLRGCDTLIGYGSINSIDLSNLKAQLGGVIIGDITHRGKGYGLEAHELLLQYAFHEIPLHKLYGYCLEEHFVSRKLMASLGMSLEGIYRDDVYKNGSFHSVACYSILRNEYEKIVKEKGVFALFRDPGTIA